MENLKLFLTELSWLKLGILLTLDLVLLFLSFYFLKREMKNNPAGTNVQIKDFFKFESTFGQYVVKSFVASLIVLQLLFLLTLMKVVVLI